MAAWANVPEVFITFAVSFAFLELRTSRIDVDGGVVFDGVAAQALHPDLRWDLGAEQDLDLEQGRTSFVLLAEGFFPSPCLHRSLRQTSWGDSRGSREDRL